MAELTYALCQQGESLRKQKAEHLPHITIVHAGVFATELGRKVKFTKHSVIPVQHPNAATLGPDSAALHNILKMSFQTASECASPDTWKVYVGGMPTFDFGEGKMQARVQHGYALQGVQYRAEKECLPL